MYKITMYIQSISFYRLSKKKNDFSSTLMNCFSRVVICPILYAPKYCDDRLPPGNNYLAKVFEVNAWIHRFNETSSGIPMHLDSQGLVAVPTCSSDGVRHDYSKWREPTWNRMLHMGKEAQESAAQQLLQVFDTLEAIQE